MADLTRQNVEKAFEAFAEDGVETNRLTERLSTDLGTELQDADVEAFLQGSLHSDPSWLKVVDGRWYLLKAKAPDSPERTALLVEANKHVANDWLPSTHKPRNVNEFSDADLEQFNDRAEFFETALENALGNRDHRINQPYRDLVKRIGDPSKVPGPKEVKELREKEAQLNALLDVVADLDPIKMAAYKAAGEALKEWGALVDSLGDDAHTAADVDTLIKGLKADVVRLEESVRGLSTPPPVATSIPLIPPLRAEPERSAEAAPPTTRSWKEWSRSGSGIAVLVILALAIGIFGGVALSGTDWGQAGEGLAKAVTPVEPTAPPASPPVAVSQEEFDKDPRVTGIRELIQQNRQISEKGRY